VNILFVPVRSYLFKILLSAFILLQFFFAFHLSAYAQSAGPPALPILYSGTVFLDDSLLSGTEKLTVRVGGWESKPANIIEGNFQLLIAGPPDSSYDGKPITFWLRGLKAEQQFVFKNLPHPKAEYITLYFFTPRSVPTPALASPPEVATSTQPLMTLPVILAISLGVLLFLGLVAYIRIRKGTN